MKPEKWNESLSFANVMMSKNLKQDASRLSTEVA
jgi:hypothetical protein